MDFGKALNKKAARGGANEERCRRLFAVALSCALFFSSASVYARSYDSNVNYLADTSSERESVSKEMVMMQPPKVDGPTLTERLFNDKLNHEFKDRYEEQFGRTEEERIYNAPNRYTYYDDLYGFKGTPQEEDDQQKNYANFVLRRLLEYHIDNYAQHDTKLKTAWAAKERLKEVKVEIGQVHFDVNYSIAGNSLDLKMNNPYFQLARVRFQMDPGTVGPAPLQETTVSVGRSFTPKMAMETHYKVTDGVLTVIGRRSLTSRLGSTLQTSTFTLPTGITPRESKYLAGLSYVF